MSGQRPKISWQWPSCKTVWDMSFAKDAIHPSTVGELAIPEAPQRAHFCCTALAEVKEISENFNPPSIWEEVSPTMRAEILAIPTLRPWITWGGTSRVMRYMKASASSVLLWKLSCSFCPPCPHSRSSPYVHNPCIKDTLEHDLDVNHH